MKAAETPQRAAELELIDTLAALLRSLIEHSGMDTEFSHVEFDGELVSVQSVLDFADETVGTPSVHDAEFH